MTTQQLLKQLQADPENIEFETIMAVIHNEYNYTPCSFSNGPELTNMPGTNEGSCKIFAFAKMHGLDKKHTLACFGKYYREDVLLHPDNTDHDNIRSFIRHGWDGIVFDGNPLNTK